MWVLRSSLLSALHAVALERIVQDHSHYVSLTIPYDSPTEWIHTLHPPLTPHRAHPSPTSTCISRPSQADFPLCSIFTLSLDWALPSLRSPRSLCVIQLCHWPWCCAFSLTDLRVRLLPVSTWHLAQSDCLINSVGWMRTQRACRWHLQKTQGWTWE